MENEPLNKEERRRMYGTMEYVSDSTLLRGQGNSNRCLLIEDLILGRNEIKGMNDVRGDFLIKPKGTG